MLNLKALVAIRKMKNITQQQMADAMGIDRSTYTRIERGQTELKASHLPLIAQALGMKVEQLVVLIFSQDVA